MCIDLRSLSLTVSAGEMAERVSSVDVGHVRNTRTDRQHGCVAANVSRFTMKVGGKPRSVWVQARPELQEFPLDELRDIRLNNIENHLYALFERRKDNPLVVSSLQLLGFCQQNTKTLTTGFRMAA